MCLGLPSFCSPSTGVRQGDALSTILFNLILHTAVSKIHITGTIANKTQEIFGYAEDMVLNGRNIVALKELFHELEKEGKQIELNINDIKTKYIKISNKQNTGLLQELTVIEYKFQQVSEFTYLDSSLNGNNKIEE